MNAFAWALLLTSSLGYLFFATVASVACVRACLRASPPEQRVLQ